MGKSDARERRRCKECRKIIPRGKKIHRGNYLWDHLEKRQSPDGIPYTRDDKFCDKCKSRIKPVGQSLYYINRKKALELEQRNEVAGSSSTFQVSQGSGMQIGSVTSPMVSMPSGQFGLMQPQPRPFYVQQAPFFIQFPSPQQPRLQFGPLQQQLMRPQSPPQNQQQQL